MARKLSRSKRKAAGITLKPREGLWISYRLRMAGLKQEDIAARAGLSQPLVANTLAGRKNSERTKAAIVEALGFASWEALIAAARRASRDEVAA